MKKVKEPTPCAKCGHPYIEPCDGNNPACGNLLGLQAVPAAEPKPGGKKPRKGRDR